MKTSLKKLSVVAILLFVGVTALATLKGAPFQPHDDKRFSDLENANAGGTLDSARLIVGSSGNVATGVDVTGDVTISNTGVTAIGAGKVTEAMLKTLASQTAGGLNVVRLATAIYDCATDCTVGAHSLGVALPAKALIIRSWLYTVTQMSDTGTCTIAFSCEDANNIKTATDFGAVSADTLTEGASTGATSAMTKSIASACNITATTADGGSCVPSTGKMMVFVEYVVLQ